MKEEKFDPNGIAQGDTYFGLPERADAKIVIIPVPWEVTVSYRAGAACGPDLVREGSLQVDLFDPDWGNFWQSGISSEVGPVKICRSAKSLRPKVVRYLNALQQGKRITKEHTKLILEVYKKSRSLHDQLKSDISECLLKNKKVILVGGDHSTPLGFYEALSDIAPGYGILHLDAHMDLRAAYEGFEHSHASIMYNALQLSGVQKIVQVGIRDFCAAEMEIHAQNEKKLSLFTDRNLHKALSQNQSWDSLVKKIVAELPSRVHVSFDIDALVPSLCPNTGTPVPGGLEFNQVNSLFLAIRDSGRTVVGADLVEVAGSDWDGNVGARVLYQLCGLLATT